MGMQWTPSQKKAIETPIGQTIVSAGAGSGKTAVLTERVIQHVLNGEKIESFLIVTFTKAAALEMKERIRLKLQSLTDAGHPHLEDALLGLDLAHISTFDSFSLFIVQKYGYLLGLTKDVSIGDAIYIDQQKNCILDAYFESLHKTKDEGFLNLLKTYSTKSSSRIKTMVLTLADSLIKTGQLDLKEEDLNRYYTDEHRQKIEDEFEARVQERIEDAKLLTDVLLSSVRESQKVAFAFKVQDALRPLFEAETAGEAQRVIKAHQWPKKPSKLFTEDDEPFNTLFDDLKKHIKALGEWTEEPLDEAITALKNQRPFVETLLRLAQGFNALYLGEQKAKGLFDFQTMAILSLTLLENHPKALEELAHTFKEILIDEYQDTSPLQDKIIERIARENVYIVGDIKQSIYRFRDASPDIFKDKYHRFPETGGTRIELSENFRSRREVIDSINALFEVTFDETLGGIKYTGGQPLKFGLKTYDTEKASKDYGMNLITYDEAVLETLSEHLDYSSKDDQAMFVESLLMARTIKKALREDAQTYDKKTNTLRNVTVDDFVILIDRKTRFDVIQDAFNLEQVPIYAHKEENFISHTDVLVTINLFKLFLSLTETKLTQELFKHSFLSVAYSYLLDVTQDDIVRFLLSVRAMHPEAIFEASEGTALEGFFKTLKSRVKAFELTPLHALLDQFNHDFKLLEKGLSLGSFKAVEERYLFIQSRLREFSARGESLKSWVEYLDYTLQNNDPSNPFFSLDIDYVQGTKLMEKTVNVMSIHKSKGLEFPFVFYPGLSARLRTGDKSSVTLSSDYGIIFDIFDEGLKAPITEKLHHERTKLEDLSEKMRVFYVALTRARESMTAFIPKKDADFILESVSSGVPLTFRKRMTSYKALMQLADAKLKVQRTHVHLDETFFVSQEASEETLESTQGTPLKYQTYEGVAKAFESTKYSMDQTMWMDASTVRAIDLGNQMHDAFEHIDFHGDIPSQIKALSQDQAMKERLETFFTHPMTQSLIHHDVYKEIPFREKTDEGIKKGIIDLVFVDDASFTVVDYKLKTTDKAGYKAQVQGYVDHLKVRLNKPGTGYLYSIMEGTFLKVV